MFEIKNLEERNTSEFMGHISYNDSPFYLSDISQSGIFERLLEVDSDYKIRVIDLCSRVLEKIITQSGRVSGYNFFKHGDPIILLYDEDLSKMKLEDHSGYRSDGDIKNLIVVLLQSAQSLMGGGESEIRKIVYTLPDKKLSRLTWRMHLTLLSQQSKIFAKELEEMFFKLFEVENTYDVQGGPEYKMALKKTFAYIEKEKEYIEKVLVLFTNKHKESIDKGEEQKWHLRNNGWEILSSIPQEFLTEEQKQKCEEVFGSRPSEDYPSKSGASKITSGIVQPRSPVEISKMVDVSDIFEKIKTDWTEEKLKKEYEDDDFLRPRGVEGLGDALKNDIQKRVKEYLREIKNEKELEKFSPHYVYSIMRGLEDLSRSEYDWGKEDATELLDVFVKITDLCIAKELFKDETKNDSWLANWTTVHKPIADSLLQILYKKELDIIEVRERAYLLLNNLMNVPDPLPKDENPEYGDLYHIAINSVRGRTFEAFTVLIEKEGKELSKEAKDLYQKVLQDTSLAVRFVVGRYLASYYFRDKDFIRERLQEIFPKETNVELFFAAWGGYLSNSLYSELFKEIESYYEYVITLDEKYYPEKREYVRDSSLDKALAIHMALGFVHLGYDYIGDGIVAKFWQKDNAERFSEFISFIGRSLLTKSESSEEFLKEQKVGIERLIDFWKWVLDKKTDVPSEVFGGFGFWINPDKEIIPDKDLIDLVQKTLQISKGVCDWETGLMKRLSIWAETQDSQKVISIVRDYLLVDGKLNDFKKYPLLYKENIKESLSVLYKKEENKEGVVNLVNDLIGAGSDMFWFLQDIEDNQGKKLLDNI